MAQELFSVWYPSVTGWLSRAGPEVKAHCFWPDGTTSWFAGPSDVAVERAYSMACLRMSLRRALPWIAHAPDEVRLHFSYEDWADAELDKELAANSRAAIEKANARAPVEVNDGGIEQNGLTTRSNALDGHRG